MRRLRRAKRTRARPVPLTRVRRQVVVEPNDDPLDDHDVQRALRAVLRRHGRAFTKLAEHDRGKWQPRKARRARRNR